MTEEHDTIPTSPASQLPACREPPVANRPRVAAGITAGALLLLASKLSLQARYPALRLDDALTVGLLVLAALPWFAPLLSSARLPGGWEFVFREIRNKQERQGGLLSTQQAQIAALRTAIRGIVTRYEHDKLVGLDQTGPFHCSYSEDLFDELKRLRALSLIRHHDGTGLARMKEQHGGGGGPFDLKQFFFITEEGRTYLRIRGQAEDKPQ